MSYTSTKGLGAGKTFSICDSASAEKKMVVRPAKNHEMKKSRMPPMAIGSLCREMNCAIPSVGGTYAFFAVALITRRKSSISAGMAVKVQISEQTTPLASTIPMSAPIFRRMKQSISSPTTVVNADERMEGAALRIALLAAMTAVRRSVCSSCSWR